jgi:hypothetical protein
MGKRGSIVVLLVASLLTVAGCARPVASGPSTPTARQAIGAFDAMYPDYKGVSAESSGAAWIVTGASVPDAANDEEWAVPVRVPIRVGQAGVATASLDGLSWTGSVDLLALTEQRQLDDDLDSIDYQLEDYMDAAGSVVTGVSRTSTDSVAVSIATSGAALPLLVFAWDASAGWTAEEPRATPSRAVPPLLGVHLPKTIAQLVVKFGEPDTVQLPSRDDPSPWGQWFRWSLGKRVTFTALGNDYDLRKANRRAGVSLIEVRAHRGVVSSTILGLEFNRSTRSDAERVLGISGEPSIMAQRSELGAGGLYRSALKVEQGGVWTYFLFGKTERLVGILQSAFDVDGAD